MLPFVTLTTVFPLTVTLVLAPWATFPVPLNVNVPFDTLTFPKLNVPMFANDTFPVPLAVNVIAPLNTFPLFANTMEPLVAVNPNFPLIFAVVLTFWPMDPLALMVRLPGRVKLPSERDGVLMVLTVMF